MNVIDIKTCTYEAFLITFYRISIKKNSCQKSKNDVVQNGGSAKKKKKKQKANTKRAPRG